MWSTLYAVCTNNPEHHFPRRFSHLSDLSYIRSAISVSSFIRPVGLLLITATEQIT